MRHVITAGMLALGLCAAAWGGGPPLPLKIVHADVPLGGGANRLDYASVDPKHRLLFIAHLGSSAVVVFNLKTDRVLTAVQDVPSVHGVLAVPALDEVFATATGQDTLYALSERSLRITARVPAGVYPDGMTYVPSMQRLFVSDEAGGTETVVDVRSNRRVATIPLGGEVGNSQYDAVSGLVYADVQTLNEVVAIDPRQDRIVHRYRLPQSCRHDHGLLLDAPARLGFIACDGNARLLVVELPDLRVLSVHKTGRYPDVLAFDPQWKILYVASESGVVTMFRLEGRELRLAGRAMLAPEAHSVAVDPKTHRVYFPLQDVAGADVLRIMAPTTH